MKLKSPASVAVLVLSCVAAFGQTVQLGFLDQDKQTQYCDYEQLTVEKSGVVVTGTHFPAVSGPTTCFGSPGLTGTIAGLVTRFPDSSGLLVTGTVATFADDTYDRLGGDMSHSRRDSRGNCLLGDGSCQLHLWRETCRRWRAYRHLT